MRTTIILSLPPSGACRERCCSLPLWVSFWCAHFAGFAARLAPPIGFCCWVVALECFRFFCMLLSISICTFRPTRCCSPYSWVWRPRFPRATRTRLNAAPHYASSPLLQDAHRPPKPFPISDRRMSRSATAARARSASACLARCGNASAPPSMRFCRVHTHEDSVSRKHAPVQALVQHRFLEAAVRDQISRRTRRPCLRRCDLRPNRVEFVRPLESDQRVDILERVILNRVLRRTSSERLNLPPLRMRVVESSLRGERIEIRHECFSVPRCAALQHDVRVD